MLYTQDAWQSEALPGKKQMFSKALGKLMDVFFAILT
jgi:hypothetical protein